ncbi:MAG TPA: C4-type zinc ribbon domain-containing protein [Anaerolineaceae bacterium]|nr:C4-type zinc ribbon domain-containing protein [Anaerolineaceae bacterium]
MSLSLTLSRLQKVDLQRDQVEAQLKSVERALQDDVSVRAARKRETEAQTSLKATQETLREAESAVHTQTIKIKEIESTLYGGRVHNPKELQDLQNDLQALRRRLSVLEDNQLSAMMSVDDAQVVHQASQGELDKAEGEYSQKNADMLAKRDALSRERERLLVERQAIAQSVTPDLLKTYESLRIQRKGVAVAMVEDQSCAACGSELTPAECQAAKSTTRIVNCPSCGRILYGG